jgi:hypothetical protein
MSIIFSTVATRTMRATQLRLNRQRRIRQALHTDTPQPQQDPVDEKPDNVD